MLYFLILTFILSKNISADSADLVKKASKIKARERQRFSADSADSADGSKARFYWLFEIFQQKRS